MTPSSTASGCAALTAARVAGGRPGRISAHATITSSMSTAPTGARRCRVLRGSGARAAGRRASARRGAGGGGLAFAPELGERTAVGPTAPTPRRAGGGRRGDVAAGRRRGVAPRATPPRSSRSTRSASACSGVPASRRARRTNAISSTSRGSAASVPRMSTTACPSVSSMRTSMGAPTCSPSSQRVLRVVGASTRTRPRADVSRNASRTVTSRSSVSRRGSCPASSSSPSATSAPATSSSATAPRIARRRSNALPTEQGADLLEVDAPVGDGLVEQRQRVAHRPGAGARDHRERLVVGVDPFLRADVDEVRRRSRRGCRA